MEEKTVIYLDIEEEDMYSGVEAISFVDEPAIQIDWQTYSKEGKKKFKKDDVKRIITSPVMLAETPIYRYSEEMGEYYVKYSADSIFKMRNKFHMDGYQDRVNEMHDSKRPVKDVYMVESFIVGDKVKSELYPDLPNGTWVASWFVKDEEYYNKLVSSDEFNGVSLEGYFIENYEMKRVNKVFKQLQDIVESDLHEVVKFELMKKLLSK